MCYTLPMSDSLSGVEKQPVRETASSPTPEATEESSVEADEQAWEQLPETEDAVLHAEQASELEAAKEEASVKGSSTLIQPSAAQRDEIIIEVERVLEEDIGAFFAALPEDAKPLFKKKGEEAAREISDMVRNVRIQTRRVLQLIYAWLKTIPGVNKFFLEQEAKLKTDRIIQLAEERRHQETKL